EVEHLWREDLLATVGEQLLRQQGGALARLADLLEPAVQGRIVSGTVEGELTVAVDHAEHIVEIVRDAPGEPADCLHLLGLPQLLLTPAQRLLRLLSR